MAYIQKKKTGLLIPKGEGGLVTSPVTVKATPQDPKNVDLAFVKGAYADPKFKNDARMRYYADRLDSLNYGNRVGELNALKNSPRWQRQGGEALADSLLNSPDRAFWGKAADATEQRVRLGEKQFTDWQDMRSQLKPGQTNVNTGYDAKAVTNVRAGANDPNAQQWGIRSTLTLPAASRRKSYNDLSFTANKTYDANKTGEEYNTTFTVVPRRRKQGGLLNGKKL